MIKYYVSRPQGFVVVKWEGNNLSELQENFSTAGFEENQDGSVTVDGYGEVINIPLNSWYAGPAGGVVSEEQLNFQQHEISGPGPWRFEITSEE